MVHQQKIWGHFSDMENQTRSHQGIAPDVPSFPENVPMSPWEMMLGRPCSFWNGPFLGGMLIFRGVHFSWTFIVALRLWGWFKNTAQKVSSLSSSGGLFLFSMFYFHDLWEWWFRFNHILVCFSWLHGGVHRPFCMFFLQKKVFYSFTSLIRVILLVMLFWVDPCPLSFVF